jgi:hypothetical protein
MFYLKDDHGYRYHSTADLEKELDCYDRRSKILVVAFVLSATALVVDLVYYLPWVARGGASESIPAIILFALLLATSGISVILLRSEGRKIKPLADAMLTRDLGIYIADKLQRKKFGVKKKYLPFEMIRLIYLNGELGFATVVKKSGEATTLAKRTLPDLVAFEKKWGDRIRFFKNKCYLWYHKKNEGVFTIVKRIDFSIDRAYLHCADETMEIPFHEVHDIYAIPWKGSPIGAIITFHSKPNRGFVTFKGGDLFKLESRWKKYKKETRRGVIRPI